MPTSKEIADALDNLRELILAPPDSSKIRQQKLMQVYRVLRKLQPDHSLYREPEPEAPKPEPEE